MKSHAEVLMGDMVQTVKLKKTHIVAALLILLLLIYILTSNVHAGWTTVTLKTGQQLGTPGSHLTQEYSLWPPYSNKFKYNEEWFQTNCWQGMYITIVNLVKVIETWSQATDPYCIEMYRKFVSIYDVRMHSSDLIINKSFEPKVRKWLGNNEKLFQEALHQNVIKVFNHFTHENVLINPLRDKRPIAKPDKPERQFVEELSNEAKKSCDFCNYKNSTAMDSFPRIESKHAYTASNTFKWDKWHGLIIARNHHPLKWFEEEFLDLMSTTLKWFEEVHRIDPKFKYPVIIWDLFPHASASQIHPHIHTNLQIDRYYGYIENWRFGGERYFQQTQSNYFTDMAALHRALGLTVELGNATAMAHLVPRKDDEVVIMGKNPDKDFFRLLYYTLRAYIDDMEKMCFSLAIALPPMSESVDHGQIPTYARVVTRGPIASIRSDISSVDLFVASNVNIDPYKVKKYVQNSVHPLL